MNILVANNHLNMLGGSETFTYTIIEELVKQGHHIEYFTFEKGLVSKKIEQVLGVKFMSKNSYDLILANHNSTVIHLHKKGFIIQTCHGIFPKLEQPSPKANAYISISQEVQDHLAKLGYPSILIHNSINLKRFKPLNNINKNVKSILSLCQSDEANDFIETACDELNVEFKKANKFKNPVWNIEKEINKADVIVGLGRSAYEAMACGRPVIIYDNRPYFESCGDGYAKDILGLSLKNNCSGRYSMIKFRKETFIEEIDKYNHNDSIFFRKFAEKELDVSKNILKYLDYYQYLIENMKKKKKEKQKKILKSVLGNRIYNTLISLCHSIK